jgi:phosphate-selective porin
MPRHHLGAIEVVGRYGVLDTTDRGIDGGVLDTWFTAVNWWATRRWRLSLGYAETALDKGGLSGTTRQTLTRIQWIF